MNNAFLYITDFLKIMLRLSKKNNNQNDFNRISIFIFTKIAVI